MINNSKWENIQAKIRDQIISSLYANNFSYSLPVQEAAIPLLLKNYDLAVEAQTGSGKTLSFLIPLLEKYLSFNIQTQKNIVKFLIISPTRQLCKQTYDVLMKLIQHLPDKSRAQQYSAKVKCTTGGNELKEDVDKITNSAIVLIGTIGRLKELGNHFDGNWLKKVDYLYIDEADRVLKQKGIKQLLRTVQKIRRTALFSATLLTMKPEDYEFYGMRNLAKISLKSTENTNKTEQKPAYIIPKSLQNIFFFVNNRLEKINFLVSFLMKELTRSKTIVFFNTCASVDFYTKLFRQFFRATEDDSYQMIEGIHGKLKTNRRKNILNRFTSLKNGCLFSTDVVARGIDFDHIHFIIQIDPPEDPDNYVHRIGRTARVNKPGTAILLLEKHQQTFIKYLENKQVGVKEEDSNDYLNENWKQEGFLNLMLTDRDFIEKSKKAFVSYIRSYKEHDLKYIFEFKNIDIGLTAQSFFLLRIPRVKQILGRRIQNFIQSEIDLENIPWKNQNQQLQYEMKRQKRIQLNEEREKKRQIVDIKNNKSKRKKMRSKQESKQASEMKREYVALKKSKKKNQPVESDYESEDTEEIERRMMNRFN